MNLPSDRVHDIWSGYGRLVLPLGRGRWLARSDKCGWRVVRVSEFHNCRATGVY